MLSKSLGSTGLLFHWALARQQLRLQDHCIICIAGLLSSPAFTDTHYAYNW